MNACIERRWCLLFLLIQLFVITLVFVLPQVDLLDTAFQNDSEPLTIHALTITSPLVIACAAVGWIIFVGFHSSAHDSFEVLFSSVTCLVSAVSPLRC